MEWEWKKEVRRVDESRLSSLSYSERNKYVYSLETFVIQIKYKRHYSFSSNEPPLIFVNASLGVKLGKEKHRRILFFFFPERETESENESEQFNLDLCTLILRLGLIFCGCASCYLF